MGLPTLDMEGVADEVRGRMAALRPDDVGRWGSMTVAEMVCHLRVAYDGAASSAPLARVKTGLPPGVLKWGALRAPMRWPRNVKTAPALERGGRAYRVPGDFVQDRAAMVAAMEAFLRVKDNRRQHPFFGAMEPWDWMRWGLLHADHHLRQFGR